MRARQLCTRAVVAVCARSHHPHHRVAVTRAVTDASFSAVVTPHRHTSTQGALAEERLGDVHHGSDVVEGEQDYVDETVQGSDDRGESPRRPPLASRLLPHVCGPTTEGHEVRLALPTDRSSLARMQRIMQVRTKADLAKALYPPPSLETETDCIRLINHTLVYIERRARVEALAQSSSFKTRRSAAYQQRELSRVGLSTREERVLLQKVCSLVEQRRVSIVVASRLLRFRWPDSVSTSVGGVRQSYVMDLIRSWATEMLQKKELKPRDARALLENSAFALRALVQRTKRESAGTATNEVASFIGALTAAASEGMQSSLHAEGLIGLMWAVHSTGCPAPASFWDAMVQRVVTMNESLDSELVDHNGSETAETLEADKDTPSATPTSAASPSPKSRSASARRPRTGHFFSTLSTRQLYRFLMVLKMVRWDGDPTVLHQVADQTLRNIAFELEAADFAGKADRDAEAALIASAAAQATIRPFSTTNAVEVHLGEVRTTAPASLPEREVARRIRHIADLQPHEFLELLRLSADLGVSFGVSATRIADELLTPLVAHLTSDDLGVLLQIVRRTHSQSTALLQAVFDRIVDRGPAAPSALPLSTMAIQTASKASATFQSMHTDTFTEFFCNLCEAQHTLIRPAQVAVMGEMLYVLGRRYEESSVQGQRIREVVNLLCAQMDRLVQLQVASPSASERLLEPTVLLRMRGSSAQYPAVQDLLTSRAVAMEKEEVRREAREERVVRVMDEAPATDSGDGVTLHHGAEVRWEDLTEKELPRVSRAAFSVYSDLAYLFERMVVVKATMTAKDYDYFDGTVKRTGLYNILLGVQLFHQGHLQAVVPPTTATAQAAGQQLDRTLPVRIEKAITQVVLAKVSDSGITASHSDDDILKVLGQVHCDEAKVDAVIEMMAKTPLRRLQRKRPVWLYIAELARRFGSDETKKALAAYLQKVPY